MTPQHLNTENAKYVENLNDLNYLYCYNNNDIELSDVSYVHNNL